jgi:hypothetical protein
MVKNEPDGDAGALIKKKINFFSYIRETHDGAVAKSYMTNSLII